MNKEIIDTLEGCGIRPTPNRLLVMQALKGAESPVSLIDLETQIETLERSSVLRVLTLLLEHRIVHIMEDGKGVSRYELCNGHSHGGYLDDMHVHFYCEECEKTYCLENLPVPHMNLPEGFAVESANFMIKGVCPRCGKH